MEQLQSDSVLSCSQDKKGSLPWRVQEIVWSRSLRRKKENVGQTNGRRIHLRLEGRSLPYLHRPRRRRKPFVDLDSPEVIVYIALPLGCLTLSKELSRICRTFGTSLFIKETELLCSLVSFLTGSFKRHFCLAGNIKYSVYFFLKCCFHIFISYYRILNANQ